MIFAILGWLNAVLLFVMLLPYIIRVLGTHIFHWHGKGYTKTLKVLRAIHRPTGLLLLVCVVVHGILALGSWRLHTGMILGIFLIITVTFGGLFAIFKKKALFSWHKRMVVLTILLLAVHLLFPSAVYLLFGI